jgi:hypothetical protein
MNDTSTFNIENRTKEVFPSSQPNLADFIDWQVQTCEICEEPATRISASPSHGIDEIVTIRRKFCEECYYILFTNAIWVLKRDQTRQFRR